MSISDIYSNRNKNGVYDDLINDIFAMDRHSMANAEYNVDFFRLTEDWAPNYIYRNIDGSEFRTNIIGEMQSSAAGTIITAKGNHYSGRKGEAVRIIKDDKKVKDVLVIGPPSLAPIRLNALYHNQVAGLNTIRELDEQEEESDAQKPTVREWICNATTDNSKASNLIMMHMEPKYAVPETAVSTDKPKRLTKRASVDSENKKGNSAVVDDKSNTTLARTDEEPTFKIGGFYEPTMLIDYGGPLFGHVNSKLVQLDVVGVDGELVPPWQLHEALRPGTLNIANCSLHCFILKDDNKIRKVYQINAHNIRILDDSEEDFEVPHKADVETAPSIPKITTSSTPKSDKRTASDTFKELSTSAKRRRQQPPAVTPSVAEPSGSVQTSTASVKVDASTSGFERVSIKPGKIKSRKGGLSVKAAGKQPVVEEIIDMVVE